MITEDYVSFEIAKLLKEKGFDYQGFDYIDFEGEVIKQDRPTLQIAMKWLREEHNLYIQPKITIWPQKGYSVKIYLYRNRYNDFEEMPFIELKESYEETCEAAIKYCLENLI